MRKLKPRILEILEKSKFRKSPEAEADLILLHAFQKENPKLHRVSELLLLDPVASELVESEALRLAEQRAKGLPLQHLLGNQFFYEHEYCVNDSTLIPRPETEVLVQAALDWCKHRFLDQPFRFAELGIGSGIISGEILSHFKHSKGVASEVNPLAIALARQNIQEVLGTSSIDQRISIFEPASHASGFEIFLDYAPFDLILSNPPYLSVKDPIEEEVMKYEPHSALFPKVEGEQEQPDFFYENFLLHAKNLLKPDGMAFFEVSDLRAGHLQHEFENAGFFVRLIPDLTGRNRVLQASLKN